MSHRFLSFFVATFVALASADATTRTVTTLADNSSSNDGVLSLREAIATAAVGDTIDFAVTGVIRLEQGELGISRSLNIVGPEMGPSFDGAVTISAEDRSRVFSVTGGTVVISNLAILDGRVRGTDVAPGSVGAGGDAEGGGVYVGPSATLTLSKCLVASNDVIGGRGGKTGGGGQGVRGGKGNGGGIANRGHLTVRDCSFSNNTATGGVGGDYGGGRANGGGIFNGGSGVLTMTGCTLFGNVATGGTVESGPYSGDAYGGGFANGDKFTDADVGIFTLANCTFSSNRASGADGSSYGGHARGGGIFAERRQSGSVVLGTVTNCTLVQNSATGGTPAGSNERASAAGGGVAAERGHVQLSNTLTWINTIFTSTAGPFGNGYSDVAGDAVKSLGYNFISIIDGTSPSTWQSTDNTGTASTPLNPQLGDFDSFGLLRVYRLKPESAAVDAGKSPLTTDQRGAPRPMDHPAITNAAGGNGSDIGAFELRPPTTFVVTNNNDSGAGSLRQAIADAVAGDTVAFSLPANSSIVLTSGELGITKNLTIAGPGANQLTVQRSSAGATPEFRVFNVGSGVEVTLSGLRIANGKTSGFNNGAGIANAGTLNVTGCTVEGNSAGFGGGGIGNTGTLRLTNSTVANNVASNGGGIMGGILVILNSTISGNQATSGNGGGLTVTDVTITNSTVARNFASNSGGGIFNNGFNGATIRARNMLVALNTAGGGPDVSGQLTSENHNLIGNNAGATIAPQSSDQIGTPAAPLDPLLGPLQDNGGPTPTIALLAGSPAINAANDSVAPRTDQRGYPRVGMSDIGAFEFGSTAPPPTPTPTPTATPGPTATPVPGRVANIATRLRVETGENVLIGGLIIVGSEPKRLIVRAVGPSLGVAGSLQNPQLELYRGDELVAANDNWREAANQQEILDSTVAPSDERESAILVTVPPGAYTAVVSGVGGETGVGSVEAYDLGLAADSSFANIATRGFVQTGDDVMIGGLIVVGDASQKVIVRALGPSLGIAGQLENPSVDLVDGNGDSIAFNDNWRDTQQAAIEATTIPPSNELESAIVATLPPARYTAIVRGVNDTTGVALVEVYALK